MNRRDAHFDAMLRHLGAAYYESLHGRASASDVARALDSVEEHVGEKPARQPQGAPGHAGEATGQTAGTAQAQANGEPRRGRWHRRVRDVMTTSVVTVDRITPYKEIVTLLEKHEVSAVPVLIMGRRVAGVISEADLLAVEGTRAEHARIGRRSSLLHLRSHPAHAARTAGELMTSPAITIHPDATIPAAARLMNRHHVKRLPVVDPAGTLIGIVSRRDLLTVFLRPDADIAADVRAVFDEILFAEPGGVTVAVRDGVVTLTGQAGGEPRDLIGVGIRLTWDIDGVVDVVNELTTASAQAGG